MVSAALSGAIVASKAWHGKHTLDHDLESVQKFHAHAVPRVGGVAIFSSIASMLLVCWLSGWEILSGDGLANAVLLLTAGFLAFGAGVLEDLTKNVSVKGRLLASIASALAASWLLGATVDALDIWVVDTLLTIAPIALLVTAVVVAGGVNAVNIIDGFNGLASSVVILMLLALAAVGNQVGDALVVELAILGVGAALGFLCVNYPTGRLFLGDGGAYLLGFWVAEVAVLLLVRNSGVSAWQILSICAFPVIEVLYSIYRRRIVRRRNPGDPDGLHLHTLIYRRVVRRWVSATPTRPWKRNAAVVCVMMPAIALAEVATVTIGDAAQASMAIVAAQLFVYIAVYRRIVCGRWLARHGGEGSALGHSDARKIRNS
jgi:UDP-N-acetylmuramyl pentapeptide phosphotransferase/UDP-N-acetylglucosamine-1-phosphate transferase